MSSQAESLHLGYWVTIFFAIVSPALISNHDDAGGPSRSYFKKSRSSFMIDYPTWLKECNETFMKFLLVIFPLILKEEQMGEKYCGIILQPPALFEEEEEILMCKNSGQ